MRKEEEEKEELRARSWNMSEKNFVERIEEKRRKNSSRSCSWHGEHTPDIEASRWSDLLLVLFHPAENIAFPTDGLAYPVIELWFAPYNGDWGGYATNDGTDNQTDR